jgi:CHAT domain-containing protein/tetratricopeptide (TPR) repeat protein
VNDFISADEMPPGAEEELEELSRLEASPPRTDTLLTQVNLIEALLRRFGQSRYRRFLATLQAKLGQSYTQLATTDRAVNLRRAIDCFGHAIAAFPADLDPRGYATYQTYRGAAYTELPTGDREENLRRAIDCFEEALRFHRPDLDPALYAATLQNLGSSYINLPTGDRGENLRRAIECFERALRLSTSALDPLFYAKTRYNLGVAYRDLPSGDDDENLQRAIECFEEALASFERGNARLAYAQTQHDLGFAYAILPTGDRGENLRRAIDCYQKAVRCYGPELQPHDYAQICHDSGVAHSLLPTGDRGKNLQRAIAFFEEALRYRSPAETPLLYASTQQRMATAYREFATGDREENLRRAIACSEEAFRFQVPASDPQAFATAKSHLGVDYCRLKGGDRAENLWRAIECFEEALRLATPEADPRGHAYTQLCLGGAYSELPTGDRGDNLRRAIGCLTEALRFHTPEADPLGYAQTQSNIGRAYAELPTGDRGDNLRHALECFEEALRCLPREADASVLAMIRYNQGRIYVQLPIGDRAERLECAIECFEEALRVLTPESDPRLYASSLQNLGTAYRELPTGDRAANVAHALRCYTQALRHAAIENDPDTHRRIASALGDLHFRAGDWRQAEAAYEIAVAAADVQYRASSTIASRHAELTKFGNLAPDLAFCLGQRGKFNEAVERLEAGRARHLAEVLERDQAVLDGLGSDKRRAFEAARDRIGMLEVEVRGLDLARGHEGAAPRPFSAISGDLRSAHRDLDAAIASIRAERPEFMAPGLHYADIAAAALPESPLVYLATTPQGTVAFIVPCGVSTLNAEHAIWAERFRSEELSELLVRRDTDKQVVGGYLVGQVTGDLRQLSDGLDAALPILREHLIAPLTNRLAALGFRRATMLPIGRLALLPLHAASSGDLTISYVPSARVMRGVRRIAGERAELEPALLAVGNPLPNPHPLHFAGIEVLDIASLFVDRLAVALTEHAATGLEVAREITRATHVHLACHGTFDSANPLDSALSLANDDRLTLRHFLDGRLNLSATRLVVLSACQTGLIDFKNVPDEMIGFPAGVLQAGVPGVVSTLWHVDDLSTAILMGFFYREHLGNGLDPASALHRAQDRLRTTKASDMKLAELYERRYQESDRTDPHAYRAMRYYRANPDVTPFTHPSYWAGFIFTGVA